MAKLLFIGTCGSDDPTRAAMPLMSAKGALEAGHETEVILLGEAVYLMKSEIADALEAVAFGNVGGYVRDLVAEGVTFYI
ncbi:MAG TPA: DsrE family protein [Longimicrobiales bacterium]